MSANPLNINLHFSRKSGLYRYTFNGKESDSEASDLGEGTQDYGFRIYNPSLGKFLSVDPLHRDYPWYTPFQFAGNLPIWAVDIDGLEPKKSNEGSSGQQEVNRVPEEYRKSLPGFPKSERLKHRNGSRPSWSLGKGWHAEWDYQHGEVEVYNRKKKHEGAFDPETGEKKKEGKPDRKPTYDSVAMDKLKADGPDVDLRVITPEEAMSYSQNGAKGSSQVAIAQEQISPSEKAIYWPSPCPAPLGVVVPPYGTQSNGEAAKAAFVITGWILIIESGGLASPILLPSISGL